MNREIVRLCSRELLREGIRGIIAEMPPRHGKSELCSHWLPPWYLINFPEHRVALASYGDTFASSWGRKSRNELEEFGPMYGIQIDNRSRAIDNWQLRKLRPRQMDVGGMLTAGIGGQFTGRGANLLIVDDPVKNAAEAFSKVRRDAVWDWWTSTAGTRLEPDAVVLVIMTRWHDDDLAGRLLRNQSEGQRWLEIKLPALAQEMDPLGRAPGEALWPERYPASVLNARREEVGSYVWHALYQQQPAGYSGGIFERDAFRIVDEVSGKAGKAVRRWDLAASEGEGDFTAGVLMEVRDGKVFITDVKRGQWSADQTERLVKECAQKDGYNVKVRMEQERGGAGKIVIARYRKLLTGYSFAGDYVTGDKTLRAMPYAAAVERGDVHVLNASWTDEFLTEHSVFDRGAHDDQVDAASGAYTDLFGRRSGVQGF